MPVLPFERWLSGCRLSNVRRLRFQAATGQFGGVLRFEARLFFGGSEILQSVEGDLVAGLAVLLENLPIVRLFFHFVLLVFDTEFFGFAVLRFEPKVGFARFGSEL